MVPFKEWRRGRHGPQIREANPRLYVRAHAEITEPSARLLLVWEEKRISAHKAKPQTQGSSASSGIWLRSFVLLSVSRLFFRILRIWRLAPITAAARANFQTVFSRQKTASQT